MIRDAYLRIPRRIRRVFITVAALLVLAFLGFFFSSLLNSNVPTIFSESRELAARHAGEIVELLKDTSASLDMVSELEKQGKEAEALNIVVAEIQKNMQAKEKALRLLSELEKMAREVPNVKPERARQTALIAISAKTAVSGKLILYSEYLAQLLDLLRERLLGRWADDEKINSLIADINKEIEAINNLNQESNEKLKEFDSYM